MALLTCSKCGQLISDKVNNCIFCGANIMYFDKATWDNNKQIFDRLMSDILDRSQRLYKMMLNAGETSILPWLEVFSKTGEILSADLFQVANVGFEKSLKDLVEKNIINTSNATAAAIISEAWLPDESEKHPLFAKKEKGSR